MMENEIETITVPKVLINRLKRYIEYAEMVLQYENGSTLEELVDVGDMPIEYYEICKLLEEHDNK